MCLDLVLPPAPMKKRTRRRPTHALNPRHARFVAEYLVDLNATQAAIRAGYSRKTANEQGARLLANVSVAAAIAAGTARHLDRAELSAVRVLEELRRLAFSNVHDLFDADGNLRPIHRLTREEAASIASLEVVIKNVAAGDGHTDTIHKLKLWDKVRTLETLAKHFKLLVDRIEVTGIETFLARVAAARKRVAPKENP